MTEKFKFRANDKIGAASAEDDEAFLNDCFVDSGEIEYLTSPRSTKQIVIGRTGSGKSAILWKIQDDNKQTAITLCPDNLALTYVSNSDIVISFSKLGINLEPFFKLLWRHILTVEILKKYVENHPRVKNDGFFDTIWTQLKGKGKERKSEQETLTYLKTWGESFWLETEYRVKEITKKLEEELKASVNASLGDNLIKGGFSFQDYSKLTEEQKIDVKQNAQKVVSSAQVRDLSKVTELIDSVLDNKQQTYYLLIDGLDENWVEDQLRYKLIMALIVTIKDLNKVKNVKIIISMRRDLIDRVFRFNRTSGFQEEKYRDYYSTIKWDKQGLTSILDKRINHLIRDRYQSRKALTHKDVLPKKINQIDTTEYIFERVNRPRDVIALFNTCIEVAKTASKISSNVIKIAEGEYSRGRIRALADEWQADYPKLIDVASILKGRPSKFKLSNISQSEIEEYALKLVIQWDQNKEGGYLEELVNKVVDGKINHILFKTDVFRIFYTLGLVGLKLESFESYSWADETGRSVSISEITENISVTINPTYFRTLGIKP